MQTIQLKKFGTVLISRPAGREAFHAIRPTLSAESPVQIDFEGVFALAPSWFDEFLTLLVEYMDAEVELLPTDNASVRAILPVLRDSRDDAVADVVNRALGALEEE